MRLGTKADLSADFGAPGSSNTALAYRQPVATKGPQPRDAGSEPGFVWSAALVETCVGQEPAGSASISNGPWSLAYNDNTAITASSTGYSNFPSPEFPFGEKQVFPGHCVRGWITFAVPGNKRPVAIRYSPEGVPPREWAVPPR